MLAITDVHYVQETARAAAVVVAGWQATVPLEERVAYIPDVEPYVPGQFFRRELPCLLAVLAVVKCRVTTVVVDGHVWLGGRPGLGHHLYEALGRGVPVVGIAKNPFHVGGAIEVLRGDSERPLFVTAVGMPADEAAEHVRAMAGPYRIPELCARADALARAR